MKVLFILSIFIVTMFSKELERVSIQLTWKHQFSFAGIYTAYEKCFYKDAGLDVYIKDVNFDGKLFENIENGKSTYSMMTSDVSLFQYEGKRIVALASYLKRNILVFATKSHIKSIQDFKGKKIIDNGYLFKTALYVLLRQHGLDKDDITLVKRDHENFIHDFISDPDIVAISSYLTTQLYDFKKAGIDIGIINPSEHGIHNYGLNLFTSEKEFEENYERAQRFKEATNRGWDYAFSHKKEIVDLIYNKYSKHRSKEALLFEAQELEKLFQLNIYKIGEFQPELQDINLNLYKKLDLIDKNWFPPHYSFFKKYQDFFSKEVIYSFSILLFLLVSIFIYKSYILKAINIRLQKKIDIEVEKINKQNRLIYHQNKMVSMGEMIDNIAHQWRQPLAQINSTVFKIDEELNSESFNKKQLEKKLTDIELFTQYMSNTIEDFSSFVKKDKQKVVFNLYESVDDSLKILNNIITKYNLNITVDIQKNIFLDGFKSEFQQLFLIFINNAKDAFIKKDIQNRDICISAKEMEKYICLNICDNAGGGVCDDILPKIFQAYFTSKDHGTGIGLSIAKMIIENSMDGDIIAVNKNNGLCVNIVLKAKRKDEK